MKILLIAFFTIFCMNNAQAQSHIANANYGCRLKPGSLNTEKDLCPACAASDKKEQDAKIAEEKRRFAEAQAAAKAKKEASEKERLEKIEEDKKNSESGKVYINGNNNNSTTHTSTEQIPDDYKGNPLNYNNSQQSYSNDKTVEAVGQLSDAVAPMLEQWANNIQKRRDAEQKIYEENQRKQAVAKVKEAEERFLSSRYLEKYMDKAKRGDVTAQMILYYASWALYSKEHVPQRDVWFNQALANNNLDALLQSSNVWDNQKFYDDPHSIMITVEKAANLGSVDAMVILGEYYDKTNVRVGQGNHKGGENPAKAIEWFTKAAEKGSPNAMYYLGHIYKYGRTPEVSDGFGFMKKMYNNYKELIDEKTAFEWFSKSLLPNYEVSLFNRYNSPFSSYAGSEFNARTYLELSYFYKEGKFVEKDVKKAKMLENIYKNIRTDYKAFSF